MTPPRLTIHISRWYVRTLLLHNILVVESWRIECISNNKRNTIWSLCLYFVVCLTSVSRKQGSFKYMLRKFKDTDWGWMDVCFSVSLCFHVPVDLRPLSISLYIPFSLCLSLSIHIPFSLSLSLFHSFTLSLSPFSPFNRHMSLLYSNRLHSKSRLAV